ncbi:Major facilitator superfamily transporter [Alteracholeplasma palmae J233]|uniref:Major facilitator superfamily transporter n=1 Tax=Alteracholeplasma palmae (strain ATCC 49389 / J233) TaxID=1318466 RepID=U4KLM6_ALTPJ|nr:MFS transporter [Alteracholeplasma palmae]CCV64782.1 Major facilitator superfamily transporter [Alteracholeplasma palmae J233]
MLKSFKHTLRASHTGYIVQSININFIPLLFIYFNQTYDISLEKISYLILINFLTQLATDLVAAYVIDKVGFRKPVMVANFLAATGFILLAILPGVMDPFFGMAVAVLIYAIGGGLLEVVLSPIVESCETENKDKEMIKLYAFYSFGQVAVVLISTLFFLIFGINNWQILAILWALVPILNGIYFYFVPMNKTNEEEVKQATMKELFSQKLFWIFLIIMFLTGAAEQGMSQWASTIAEKGLGISKTMSDLVGPMFYAVMMGLTRIVYIYFGHKFKLSILMVIGGIFSLVAFLLIGLTTNPIVGIIACGLCGIGMGTLWPGAIRRSSDLIKNGGGRMFAFLAFLGDIGCSVGPALIGLIAAKSGIKTGMLIGSVFPGILVVFLLLSIRRRYDNKVESV